MRYSIKEAGGYQFIDEGQGEPLLLLHGLFGALSNWTDVVEHFASKYRVLIPMMPMYEMSLKQAHLEGLVAFIEEFITDKKLTDLTLLGNSLGGHIALIYILKSESNRERVRRLILTGSSGLFEDGMGGSYPRRGNYEFVRERTAYTFYDPNIATKELVDEVYNVTSNNQKCLRMISIARSAQRHNMAKDIPNIDIPTLLIWGLNDTITPPHVAHGFDRLLPNSELRFIDQCGHAPMMEHPQVFNTYMEDFLKRNPLMPTPQA